MQANKLRRPSFESLTWLINFASTNFCTKVVKIQTAVKPGFGKRLDKKIIFLKNHNNFADRKFKVHDHEGAKPEAGVLCFPPEMIKNF